MKNLVTIEEAKGMKGVEFTYFTSDGDSVPAFVKAFDEKIGMTCFTLEPQMKSGYKPPGWAGAMMDPDGTWCLTAFDFNRPEDIQEALEYLTLVRDTGEYRFGQGPSDNSLFGGAPQCAFGG